MVFIRVRFTVFQVSVLARFIWYGTISKAPIMVTLFSCYQITTGKANKPAITRSNSNFSKASKYKSTYWVKGIACSCTCSLIFARSVHFRASSPRAWLLPTRSLLFAFQIKLRNLSRGPCMKNALQLISLRAKKTSAFPVIYDLGNFSFLGILCQ